MHQAVHPGMGDGMAAAIPVEFIVSIFPCTSPRIGRAMNEDHAVPVNEVGMLCWLRTKHTLARKARTLPWDCADQLAIPKCRPPSSP
jgi:hypothetical protein